MDFHGVFEIVDTTRRAPTIYKWSYNPYKWPYKWVTGVITLLIGVINLVINGRGPTLYPICIYIYIFASVNTSFLHVAFGDGVFFMLFFLPFNGESVPNVKR